MKSRRNSKSEENRAAAASLLADLDEEFSVSGGHPMDTVSANETYGKPTDNRLETYGKTTNYKIVKPTENHRIAEPEINLRKPKPTDTPTDMVRKIDGKPTEISSLVGFQRQAFLALAQQAKEHGFSDDFGNRITPPINGNIFAQQHLQKTYKQAKDVIYELKVGGFLAVHTVKNGRGGFVQFLLNKSHYQGFLLGESLVKPTDNRLETYGKPTGKPTDTPTEAVPCSSSIINSLLEIKTTTTDDQDFWLSVPENLKGLIQVKQLRDFVKQGLLSADDLQSSLDGFAFDLEKGTVRAKNGNPIAILIGAIKGGGYISQQYVADLKASLAAVEKARAELHQLQAENVANKLSQEFEAFREKHPEQAEKLRPGGAFINSFEPGSMGYKMWLDEYRKKQEVLLVVAEN